MAILNDLRLLLLGLWLGAAVFFSSVVAPSVFSVLRAFQLPNVGEIAGTLVTRTLSVINVSGFIISLFLLVTAFAFGKGFRKRSFFLELISLIVVAVSTGTGQWVIAAKMRAPRVAMGLPVEQVPIDDFRRVAFNRLHGYSVTSLSIAMIAALIGFLIIAYRARLNAN
ncbi:MAG: DUF4149 domain-containing protein [Pyrinomonadaceae bacterium]|nr:DUF4149 domain-containing protein [Pyrinomonadaceae bacterium]MBA3568936.1 DUF4149 domain-containing protein [Pyrinomonadaceae bacterium]